MVVRFRNDGSLMEFLEASIFSKMLDREKPIIYS